MSEDVINYGVIVTVKVSVEELIDAEPDETVLVELTGFVEISDEDCPLVLPVSELPLDKVFGEVSVRLVDWELEVPLLAVD